MDEFDTPMMMFPPDTLVARMEQLRLIVMDMSQTTKEENPVGYILLNDAAKLLLDSCSLVDPTTKKPTDGNITHLH